MQGDIFCSHLMGVQLHPLNCPSKARGGQAVHSERVPCSEVGASWRQGAYQAIRFAWGWMSRAVSPFTICITFTDSGIRGSKKRTSPLTLQERVTVMFAGGNLRALRGRGLALEGGGQAHLHMLERPETCGLFPRHSPQSPCCCPTGLGS